MNRLRVALHGLGEFTGWLVAVALVVVPFGGLLFGPVLFVACATNEHPVGTVVERRERVVDGEPHFILEVVVGYDGAGERTTELVDAGPSTGCQTYETWPDCDEETDR